MVPQAELRTVGDRGDQLHLHPGPHLSARAEWSTARGETRPWRWWANGQW